MSETAATRTTISDRTLTAGREALSGHRRGLRAFLPFAGPAVIASIAYTDPGNFATNIQGGAAFGYMLLWVVVVANLIAMLFQALSAKLGIVTGSSLASVCRDHLSPFLVWPMWLASEVAAMATDLAEFLGASIGISLLFGLGLLPSVIATGVVTYALLLFQRRGFRPIELVVGAFVGLIALAYLVELLIAPIDWGAFAYHSVVPQLAGPQSVALAVGIVGATVMPHAIYLHSSLTGGRMPARTEEERRQVLRYSNREVVIALSVAGAVNMAMLAMAASAFHEGHAEVAEIETAYHTLGPLLGGFAATVFLSSLLASGVSSSVVGTMAGQVIMQDFVGFRIPLWARRLITMIPAAVAVAIGVNVTQALVASQIVLSLVLPIPMIALIVLSTRRDIMGRFASTRTLTGIACAAAAIVLLLNAVLLLQMAGVPVPFPDG